MIYPDDQHPRLFLLECSHVVVHPAAAGAVQLLNSSTGAQQTLRSNIVPQQHAVPETEHAVQISSADWT